MSLPTKHVVKSDFGAGDCISARATESRGGRTSLELSLNINDIPGQIAKLLFIFADSAVVFIVLLLVSPFSRPLKVGRPNPECM